MVEPAMIVCTHCGGSGTVARPPGKTMDGQPVGDIAITRSQFFPALCERCGGIGKITAPPAPETG